MKKIILIILVLTNFKLAHSQNVDSLKKVPEAVVLEIIGDGTIQKAINKEGEIPSNTSIGIHFERNFKIPRTCWFGLSSYELDVMIGIVSSVDTLKAVTLFDVQDTNLFSITNINDFGSSLAFPLTTGNLKTSSFSLIGYYDEKQFVNNLGLRALRGDGFIFKTIVNNRNWTLNGVTKNATILYLKIGTIWDFIPSEVSNKFNCGVILSILNFSCRSLLGDVTTDQAKFAASIFNTNQTFFPGWEPSVTLKLGKIRAEFIIPFLLSKKGINGLSNGQFATTIGFNGGIKIPLE